MLCRADFCSPRVSLASRGLSDSMQDGRAVASLCVVVVGALAVLRLGSKRRRRKTAAINLTKRQNLDPRFFAHRDAEGNLRLSTRFIDTFLRWECGRYLLGLGLFPNVQEITESMACLEAIREHLHFVSLSDPDVCIVVVGDGRTPRTAALMAMRTKWQVVSIDPALHGLQPPSPGEADASATAADAARASEEADDACCQRAEVCYQELPKELRHARLKSQEQTAASKARRARMCDELSRVARLSIIAHRVQAASVYLGSGGGGCSRAPSAKRSTKPQGVAGPDAAGQRHMAIPLSASGHVVVVLPHAHVTPDDALAALCFDLLPSGPPCVGGEGSSATAAAAATSSPTLSVVQLPCCGYVHHDRALGHSPAVDFLDARIATSARAVRVWPDVSPSFDFGASARRRGVPRRAQDLTQSNERKRQGILLPRAAPS